MQALDSFIQFLTIREIWDFQVKIFLMCVFFFFNFCYFLFQLFDHVAEAEVILKNTGKVGFKFRILNPERDENTEHEATENRLHLYSSHKNNTHNDDNVDVIPGQPMVFPSKASLSKL